MKLMIILSVFALSLALSAKEVVIKSGECFTFKGKANKHFTNSSRMKIPFIYLSGYKLDLDKMAEDFELTRSDLTNVEKLKSVLADRISHDKCRDERLETESLKAVCKGMMLDGHINKDTNRFYAQKFTCLKTVTCNMTDSEYEDYVDSKIKEDVDLVIPEKCKL